MNYDDIINLPHHTSSKHLRMSLYDRAAQFSPFAALTGHDEAVKETARLTDNKIELDEYAIMRLNEKLQMIKSNQNVQVKIIYFIADDKKSGGKYTTITGMVKRIDDYKKVVILTDKTSIPIDMIMEMDGDIFWIYGGAVYETKRKKYKRVFDGWKCMWLYEMQL